MAADNLFAISAGRARTLIAYDLKIAQTGVPPNQYARAFEAQPGEVHALAVSGDRKLVAVAGDFGEVRVYPIATRQRSVLISKAPAPVYAVALNINGSRLALGSKSGLVQIYELPSGKLLKLLVPVPVAPPDRGLVKQ